MNLHYLNNCVNWPLRDVSSAGGLQDMVDHAVEISRRTFLKHVCRESLQNIEDDLGYTRHHAHGLTMAADYAVTYHRSKLHGKVVYFFIHSAIEYVFA